MGNFAPKLKKDFALPRRKVMNYFTIVLMLSARLQHLSQLLEDSVFYSPFALVVGKLHFVCCSFIKLFFNKSSDYLKEEFIGR